MSAPRSLENPGAARWAIWGLIIAGTALRLVLAFHFVGVAIDVNAWNFVGETLGRDPLHVYRIVNGNPPLVNLWPYPPGFFPWTVAARFLTQHAPGNFPGWVKLPMVLSDAGMAWVIQDHLRRIGRSVGERLAAVSLVAFGPPFFMISGYHGQLDAAAIFPALLAVALWCRNDKRNPLVSGLLIGVGTAVKTVPVVMLLALLPTARTWRERALLVVPAILLPALLFVPFLVTDPAPVLALKNYQSRPGMGGLSLLLQPGFVRNFFQIENVQPNLATSWLTLHGGLLTVAGLALVTPFLLRRRTAAPAAAVVIWLTVYVTLGGFLFQYLVWGLPFFLLAGHLRATAAFTVVVTLPLAIVYVRPVTPVGAKVYQLVVIALYLVAIYAWVAVCRRVLQRRPGVKTPLRPLTA